MSILERKCTLNFVCSVFAGLSGNTDQHLFPDSGDILHIREDVSTLRNTINAQLKMKFSHQIHVNLVSNDVILNKMCSMV